MSATTQSTQNTIILRPYQQELIQQIYTAWADGHKKVLAQLPTAAGKTLAFAQIAKEFAARNEQVLILTHRIELIDQAVAKIRDITTLEVGIIRSGVAFNPSAPIQVASVQSLKFRLANVPNVSVVIVDEAHHSTAAGWQSILKHFSKRYILGVTATPTRLNGDGFNDLYDVLIQGSSMQSLIKDGYLSKYRVFADPHPMSTEGVGKSGGDYKPTDLAKQNNVIELAGHLIDSYKRIADGTQAIVFAINIEHSKSIAARYNAEGISARHLDGKSDYQYRADTLELFRKGELKVITNCNLFDEGVDLPSVGCVQLAKPTQSITRYLQMVGRGLRVAEGKECAFIIDHTRNYQTHGLPDVEREWTLEGVKSNLQQLGKTDKGEIVVVDQDEQLDKQIVELVNIKLVEVAKHKIDIPLYVKKHKKNQNIFSAKFGSHKVDIKITDPKNKTEFFRVYTNEFVWFEREEIWRELYLNLSGVAKILKWLKNCADFIINDKESVGLQYHIYARFKTRKSAENFVEFLISLDFTDFKADEFKEICSIYNIVYGYHFPPYLGIINTLTDFRDCHYDDLTGYTTTALNEDLTKDEIEQIIPFNLFIKKNQKIANIYLNCYEKIDVKKFLELRPIRKQAGEYHGYSCTGGWISWFVQEELKKVWLFADWQEILRTKISIVDAIQNSKL